MTCFTAIRTFAMRSKQLTSHADKHERTLILLTGKGERIEPESETRTKERKKQTN